MRAAAAEFIGLMKEYCGTVHQRPSDAERPVIQVNDQPADHHERLRVDIFGEDDMHPPDSAAADLCDEKPLIGPEQGRDSRSAASASVRS